MARRETLVIPLTISSAHPRHFAGIPRSFGLTGGGEFADLSQPVWALWE